MAGYQQILEIRRLEEEVAKLGLMFSSAKHYNSSNGFGDMLALKPKDTDSLPMYNRDSEIFVGSIQDLQQWLRGVQWARTYDTLLNISNDKKRARKEQDELNRQLAKVLKEYRPCEGEVES